AHPSPVRSTGIASHPELRHETIKTAPLGTAVVFVAWAAVNQAGNVGENGNDLRTSYLHLHSGPATRTAQALRDQDARHLEKVRHKAGWLLDRADRQRQPRSALPFGLGLDGGPREEVDRVPDRVGMDRGTG